MKKAANRRMKGVKRWEKITNIYASGKRMKSKDFSAIVASQKEGWNKWVKGKIDAGDFRNKVLKYEKDGEKEIELSEMDEYLSMD